MGIAHEVIGGSERTLEGLRAGEERLASRRLGIRPSTSPLLVSSSLFRNGGPLPRSAVSIDGTDGSPPPLRWKGVPSSAKSISIVCEDPDVPFPEPLVHWLVYGLSSTIQAIDRTTVGYTEGLNSKLRPGYMGATPPVGHGDHRYHFQVFALDTMIDLAIEAGRTALLTAMTGHVVGWGELIGTHKHM